MSRSTVVYVSMMFVLVGGLWAVLAAGGRLVAPEDLSGRWTAVALTSAGGWPALTVEQSGNYFELAFDNGPAFGATLVDRSADGRLSLGRGPWRVTIDGPTGGPPTAARTFHVDGPAAGTFTGRRPARSTTAPVATPAAPKEAK